MMYLYVGSIVAIMCIYITVLLDNCPSVSGRRSREPLTSDGDPESGSLTSFGTLRKAHIDRTKVSRTSFYLRVGALGKPNLNFADMPLQHVHQLVNARHRETKSCEWRFECCLKAYIHVS